jgi:SHS2 domain-containing protein
VDHTAELELHVEGRSEDDVFTEALVAFGDLLAERSDAEGGERARHDVSASAPDRATLLAEWLSELVFLAESEGFVPERVDAIELSRDTVNATASGVRSSPPNLVKAVTYHRLAMTEEDGAWRATVVLDV